MPKTICHIIHGEYYSGAEKAISLICERLDRSRFHPIVICLAEGRFIPLLKAKGIESYVIGMKGRLDLTIVPRLNKFLKDKQIDIIHTHSVRTNLIGRMLSRSLGASTISTVHAPFDADSNTLRQRRINPLIEKITRPRLNKYITVAKHIEQKLLKEGVPQEAVSTIYYGIEMPGDLICDRTELAKKYDLPENSCNIGMIAAFRPRKGAEYLLRSIPEVVSEAPKANFVFIGDAAWTGKRDYMQELRQLADKLGVSEHVQFVGFCKDATEIYSLLDIVVLPSLFGEGLPLVLLEAMAMKKPVIASDIDGNNEIVNDRSGILVPPKDPSCLAEAITSLAKNKVKMQDMGEQGYLMANEMFEAGRMAREYESVYDSIIKERAAA